MWLLLCSCPWCVTSFNPETRPLHLHNPQIWTLIPWASVDPTILHHRSNSPVPPTNTQLVCVLLAEHFILIRLFCYQLFCINCFCFFVCPLIFCLLIAWTLPVYLTTILPAELDMLALDSFNKYPHLCSCMALYLTVILCPVRFMSYHLLTQMKFGEPFWHAL